MTATTELDVVVAGAGPVGAVLALALTAGGARCAVLEAAGADTGGPPGYDDRYLALALASQRILATLGLWSPLVSRAGTLRSVHVCERGRFGATRLDAALIGEDALGYVVPAHALGETLLARLRHGDGGRMLCPARLTGLRVGAEAVRIETDATAPLRARLLIGADGGASQVRACLGIETDEHDYGQTAIVCNVTPARPHGDQAFERFTPQGPLALLPLPGGRCGLVWTVPHDRAAAALALDDEAFAAAATLASGRRLGRIARVGRRSHYPLRQVRAHRQHADRVVLAGNAVHVLHPNAAQGLNLGLRDAAVLAEHVLGALRAGADPGAPDTLAAYVAARARDQHRTALLSDGLARLFGIDFAPLGCLRGLGLAAFDRLPPAKAALVRAATGLSGRVPRLALGLAP